MIKNKKIIFLFVGLIIGIGLGMGMAWITGSPFNQKKTMLLPNTSVTITPEQIPEDGPKQSTIVTPDTSANPTTIPSVTFIPTISPSQTVAPQPTQTPAPTPTQTPAPTPTQTPAPTPTQTPAPTPTQTPAFSYSVYNNDGVAPAGYTIVYIKITPNGSYHVTYNGETITKSKSGSDYITYYKTVEKLEDGNYRTKVSVTAD